MRESLGSLPEQSLLRPVLLLERARSVDELKHAVHVAVERVEALRNDELKRDVAMWLRRSLVPNNFPWLEGEGFEELRMFESRLERTVQQWTQDWLAEGRAEGLTQGRSEGLTQGRSEGRRDGEASALLRLLERKFGSVPTEARRRIQAADVETVEGWLDRLFAASTLDDVFA